MHTQNWDLLSPSIFSWLVMPLIVSARSPSALDSSQNSPAAPREAIPPTETHDDQSEPPEDILGS